MTLNEPNRKTGCWPILLLISLFCTLTGVWLSQRSALLTQQAIQRNIQIQQQQQQLQRQQLERLRYGR
jgi:hypothetical protein